MEYKTTFKKKRIRVYRIKNNFKCVASCVLRGINPKDTKVINKLKKKFKDIKITKEGVAFEVVKYAKCHKNDSFNEQKGRSLAESRCKRQVFNHAEKILRCVVEIKEAELNKAQKSLAKYGVMVETEFDHLMHIDEKKIYRVEEMHRDDTSEETINIKLHDEEFNSNVEGSIDTSCRLNVSDEVLGRAKVAVGDLIYIDVKNPKAVFQASQFALIKRQNINQNKH
jgi:hypothetical protein